MTAKKKQKSTLDLSSWGLAIIIVALIAGLAAVAFLTTSEDGDTAVGDIPAPEVTGEPLPAYEPGNAAAVGLPAPEFSGTTYGGDTVVPTGSTKPKIVLFLAHWCPHCQTEVPKLVPWLEQDGLSPEVDLFAVSSSVDQMQPNYPPDAWLEREDWAVPTVHDDGSIAAAYGLTSFPYWVLLDADNVVVERTTGALDIPQVEALVDRLLADAAG